MTRSTRRPAATAGCALLLLLAAAAPAQGQPPRNQTYFTMLLGLSESYDWEADCLKFSSAAVCTLDGLCGSWRPLSSGTFSAEFSYPQDGARVEIRLKGRAESEGSQGAIGGTGVVTVDGRASNFGFTGRSLKTKQCRKLLTRWNVSTTPNQPPQAGECLDRARFGKPERSRYILPFPAGRESVVSQTYCYLYSTHRNELAYDFDLPLGAEVIAARGGRVLEVRDSLADNSPWPDANYLKIEHDDGTVAHYIHLMQDSVPVAVGARVEQGDLIARASMSGTILPHLHFVVFQDDPPVEGEDLPVNFANCDGPIDALGGLIQDQTYRVD
jgi:murein DD-endopeptidase MepM/ murein hydrolase activator NlpD